MNRYVKFLGGLLLASTLAACGGGGGSSGTTSGGTGGTGGTGGSTGGTTSTVASFIYDLSKASLSNSGSDGSVLTVTALDANNNPVSGAAVSVAVDSGVYTPNTSTTDTKGQASGTITIGANKANRKITATITVNGQSSSAVITVAGATISLTPVPATPGPGSSTRVDLKVIDTNGAGIPNVTVTLGGTLGFTGTVTTDSTGNASSTLGAAPATPGTYSIDASALGVQSTRSVQVVSGSGSSGIPVVTDTVSSASLAIVPSTIAPNSAGSTANRAALRAKFLNSSNQAIVNVRVRFEIVAPGLGSGESLSTGTATVYSDVNGEAIADYIAGTRSSPTDGVVIRACYGPDDASIAGACPNSVTKTLTVASQPLSITLGDNNLLEKGNNSLTYIKKFDVAVADSAGNAVANAVISASVDISHYGKGGFNYANSSAPGTQTYQVTGNNPPNTSTTGINTTTQPTPSTGRVWCPNEDTNRNGSLDTSPVNEDINNNGKLEPRKADVILSFLGSNVTGANGRMTIQVEYPQNVATWLSYTVKVTTNVAGSEGSDAKSYITSFILGDETNGSFLTPPYGANRCVDAN
ncbi:MAG: hypothetical protein JWQ76_4720 [Ramlibacter sp.]|nr:hypothetical protein [Ramlibacter sp.]